MLSQLGWGLSTAAKIRSARGRVVLAAPARADRHRAATARMSPRATEASGLDIEVRKSGTRTTSSWRRRQHAYDLAVYQLGNSTWHDFMWGYLFNYPGLVVLHDTHLHHARAAHCCFARDAWTTTGASSHTTSPACPARRPTSAVEGLTGSAYYRWPMTRAGVESARLVAVHKRLCRRGTARAASGRAHRTDSPRRRPASNTSASGARRTSAAATTSPADSIVFVAFGLITAEKRIGRCCERWVTLSPVGRRATCSSAASNGFPDWRRRSRRAASAIACTSRATSEEARVARISWPRRRQPVAALAPRREKHPRRGSNRSPRRSRRSSPRCLTAQNVPRSVAIAVDLLEEDAGLVAAMSMLARDRALRENAGRAAYDYWKAEHHVSLTADDYRRVIAQAAQILRLHRPDCPRI